MFYSIENSFNKANLLLGDDKPLEAKQVYAEILEVAPDHPPSRNAIRQCLRALQLGSKNTLLMKWLSSIQRDGALMEDAVPGWIYSVVLENHFSIKAPGNASRSPSPRQEYSVPQAITPSDLQPYCILSEMMDAQDAPSLYALMLESTGSMTNATASDSFANGEQAVYEYMVRSDEILNVMIIGAGCVGLTLANALKKSFGDKIQVLVLENRIATLHVKQPYSRRWLTFIPVATLDGFVDGLITTLLKRVGRGGLIGVPLHVYETLLLLSCKCLGVKFLFSDMHDIAQTRDLPLDVVFDATGGRLDALQRPPGLPHQPGPIINADNPGTYTQGFSQFGIPVKMTSTSVEIETVWQGEYLHPLVNGAPMCIPNVKITGCNANNFERIISWVRANNHDAKFYVWPGGLDPAVNEILIFISLSELEYTALREQIQSAQRIEVAVSAFDSTGALEPRTIGLLRLVRECERQGQCMLEPPFLYAPYFRPYGSNFQRYHGVPLIPIGDSVYNGNPKAGNGLTRHLKKLRAIHDSLAKSWGIT